MFRSNRTSFCLLLPLFLTWLACPESPGAQAPIYFRSDQGVPPGVSRLPADLNAADALKWRIPLDSGHSTPLVAAAKIFATTYNASKGELATVALRENDGSLAWKRVVSVDKIEDFHRQTGNPAPCTPAFDGEHLYVFFGSYGLVCYDLEGKTVWERRMGPFRDEYGAGSSPVISGERLFLAQDHDIDSFLMALDRRSGRVLWRTARPDAVRSYSTPALWKHNGREELLVAGALELASYNPESGAKLWSIYGLARIVIPTPIPVGDTIYMASWAPGGDASSRISLDSWTNALAKWDRNHDGKLTRGEIADANVLDRFFRMDLNQSGDLDQQEWERHANVFRRAENALLAIKPSSDSGELSAADIKWRYARGVPYVATPLVVNGAVWMVKDGGLVTKLDASTGRVLSEARLPAVGSYYASPVSADEKVYFAGEQGTVSVVASGPEWKVISSRNFHEKIYASPVLKENRVFIRTEKALYCFQSAR